ncbi:hypothetical protein [Demequina aurantiaca]|uniref:hypothetical protein n=1 Tax=Demequina aurantiaca TaxID=676200 RepID=UPI003D33EA78
MRNPGLRAPIAAVLTMTLAGLTVAPAATATGALSIAEETAVAAQDAADATNQSFIDADWDGVSSNADAFDDAYDSLVGLRDAEQRVLDGLEDDADALRGTLDDAIADAEAKRLSKVGIDQDLAKSTGDLVQARIDLGVGVQRELDAEDELAGVIRANADANDAYNATVASLFVGPTEPAWAGVFRSNAAVTVQGLPAFYDASAADALPLRETANRLEWVASRARDSHSMFRNHLPRDASFWKHLGDCWKHRDVDEYPECLTEEAVYHLSVYEREAETAEANYDDAEDAATAAEGKRDAARSALDDIVWVNFTAKKTAYDSTETEFDNATDEVDAAGRALVLLRQVVRDAEDAVEDNTDLLSAAIDEWEIADRAAARLQGESDELAGTIRLQRQKVVSFSALFNGLAVAKQDVDDRIADLVDLGTVRDSILVTVPSREGAVHAGDVIEVAFTATNSQLFDLSDATISVTSPLGIAPLCDIPVDGTVPAGATVDCAADYQVTATDLLNGEITVTVVLSGYIPLGPGNPRATVVNRTFVSVTSTTTILVAAVVEPAPEPVAVTTDGAADAAGSGAVNGTADDAAAPVAVSAELSETGAADAFGSLTDAAVLVLVGLALVVVTRRKLLHQK